MYCKNCGKEMAPNQAVCLNCGVAVGTGNSFCQNCGQPVAPQAVVCTNCGVALNQPSYGPQGAPMQYQTNVPGQSSKSKIAAGLLAIFLGSLGIHNFYLGYTRNGVIQLLLTLLGGWLFGLGALAAEIWAIVDAVHIFQGTLPDSNGAPLSD